MKRICSKSLLSRIILEDPVRPSINAEERVAPAREVYHLDNKAYICLAYLNLVPYDEESLLSIQCGPIVVAYTIWSSKKGKGREGLDDNWDKFMFFELNPDYSAFVE